MAGWTDRGTGLFEESLGVIARLGKFGPLTAGRLFRGHQSGHQQIQNGWRAITIQFIPLPFRALPDYRYSDHPGLRSHNPVHTTLGVNARQRGLFKLAKVSDVRRPGHQVK